jgi:hypothetical protein
MYWYKYFRATILFKKQLQEKGVEATKKQKEEKGKRRKGETPKPEEKKVMPQLLFYFSITYHNWKNDLSFKLEEQSVKTEQSVLWIP